jgi:diaminopimelate decarboxylase
MKPRSLSDALLQELAREHGTPLFVYDAAVLRARARELLDLRSQRGRAFDVVRYAQKANPNLSVLRILKDEGCRVDAVSAGELKRALSVGFSARDMLFCADLFDRDALELVAREPFQLNAGSPFMLEQYARANPPRRDIVLRVNPGFGHGHDRKVSTGGEHSKHGIWHADLPALARGARALGLDVVGLHVHIGSGSDLEHLSRAARALVEAATHFAPTLRSLSAGGGLPIPYRAGEPRFDPAPLLDVWDSARSTLEQRLGRALSLELEPGRYLVAEAGVLLATVCGVKSAGGTEYILVDAGFHNLVRPAMYGAHHEISVLGRDAGARASFAVAGPLCESADVFTQGKGGVLEPRPLPRPVVGDLACFHDSGAYAAAMGSNYNSQLLAAEVMVHNGRARVVRPRQTWEELLRPELDSLE